jgi:hypothetical protein
MCVIQDSPNLRKQVCSKSFFFPVIQQNVLSDYYITYAVISAADSTVNKNKQVVRCHGGKILI